MNTSALMYGNKIIRIENIRTYEGKGFYVGRSTPLGNPYPLSMGRMESIDAFGKFLREILTERRQRPSTLRYFFFLRNELLINNEITLLCHCSPLPCHALEIGKCLISTIREG